ncbi:MAG: hypothetical protein RL115_211 [Bacteroidota bacterium]
MTNIYAIMGLISTVFLCIPLILIVVLKMGGHRNFMVLSFYYFVGLIYNALSLKYIPASPALTYKVGVFYVLIAPAIMLFFMTYFCTSKKIKSKVQLSIILLIIFQLIVGSIKGLNKESITTIAGPGIFLVLLFALYFFLQQTKRAIRSVKANGKALITGSIIIAYCCYLFLYLMFYVFKAHLPNGMVEGLSEAYIYLLYHLGLIFSVCVLSAGLLYESKRVKNLFESKLVRKELNIIYQDEKKDASAKARTSFDDFDPSEFIKSNTSPH